jgi:C4-dicarboxylate transporter, DctQ subunit
MARLESIASALRGFAELVVALLLASMFVTFLIQILFRYVLSLPLGWTVEYVAIAWLWGILFGYAFVIRDDDVIRLDLVYNALPEKTRRVMDVVSGLACAGILIGSLPKAYDFVTFMKVERTAYIQLRFDLVFSIYLPFAVAVIIRSLLTVWRAIRGRPLEHDPIRAAGADEYI